MKISIIPENLMERIALAVGAVPRPLLYSHVAMMLACTAMSATRHGAHRLIVEGFLRLIENL